MPKEKMKLGFYWAASCGGCEIAVLDINEKILDVVNMADIVFWPVAMDVKYKDVEAMPDKYIDICFFNGSVRTGEQERKDAYPDWLTCMTGKRSSKKSTRRASQFLTQPVWFPRHPSSLKKEC
jgi:hypothetical protein